MDIIEQREPSLKEVISANPGVDANDAHIIFDNLLAARQKKAANLADVLSQVVVFLGVGAQGARSLF